MLVELVFMLALTPRAVGPPESSPIRASPTREVRAVLTHWSGGVAVLLPGGGGEVSPRNLLALEDGSLVKIPRSAAATLICSNSHALELQEDSLVNAALCRRGKPLPIAGKAFVWPDRGRLRTVGRSLELVGEARGLPEEVGPLLLAPRNTRLLTGRPTVRWTAMEGALQYRVSLIGPASLTVDLEERGLSCGLEEFASIKVRVCSWKWPPDQPDLIAGSPYFLAVKARRRISGPWYEIQELCRFEVLEEAAAKRVQSQMEAIRRFTTDNLTKKMLLAGVNAQQGLTTDAIDLYREVTQSFSSPEVQVTLGDLHQAAGLYRMAGAYYQQAMESAPKSMVNAAAEFGLGEVHRAWDRHRCALRHFERAAAIYASLGLPDEAGSAEREARRARRRASALELCP